MITKNDLKVIKECLAASGVKNSEFQESTDANKDAYIAFVYNNQNYKIKVSNLIPIKNISLDGTNLIPDDNGNLSIDLPKSKWDVITVNYYGNTPPPPQAEEGALCYNKSEKTLWVYHKPGGWRQTPWEENFYHIKGLNMLCLYIPELGLIEIPRDIQEKLISNVNIKTINGKSLLGEGNIDIGEGGEIAVTPPPILPIAQIINMIEPGDISSEEYQGAEGEVVYHMIQHVFYLRVGNVYYTNWNDNGHSSSTVYAGTSFVYTREGDYFSLYKVTPTGLISNMPNSTPFVNVTFWVDTWEELEEINTSIGNYAICDNWLYIFDTNYTWVQVWPPDNPISDSYNLWVFLYEGDLYELASGEPIAKIMSGVDGIRGTLESMEHNIDINADDIMYLQSWTRNIRNAAKEPLRVTGIIEDPTIQYSESTYTGDGGELYFLNKAGSSIYGSTIFRFAWKAGGIYYKDWNDNNDWSRYSRRDIQDVQYIYTLIDDKLNIYKIDQTEGKLISIFPQEIEKGKEFLPIVKIVSTGTGTGTVTQSGVVYNANQNKFYYKDINEEFYHTTWGTEYGVPSSEDYYQAEFLYIVDDYLHIYKYTSNGLIDSYDLTDANLNNIVARNIESTVGQSIKALPITGVVNSIISTAGALPGAINLQGLGNIYYSTIQQKFVIKHNDTYYSSWNASENYGSSAQYAYQPLVYNPTESNPGIYAINKNKVTRIGDYIPAGDILHKPCNILTYVGTNWQDYPSEWHDGELFLDLSNQGQVLYEYSEYYEAMIALTLRDGHTYYYPETQTLYIWNADKDRLETLYSSNQLDATEVRRLAKQEIQNFTFAVPFVEIVDGEITIEGTGSYYTPTPNDEIIYSSYHHCFLARQDGRYYRGWPNVFVGLDAQDYANAQVAYTQEKAYVVTPQGLISF